MNARKKKRIAPTGEFFKTPSKRKPKMRSATRELTISKAHLEEHIRTFLYAAGFLHDEEEIVNLEIFKGMGLKDISDDGLIPLTIKYKRNTERIEIIEGDV